jgi:hypothetical protein
MPSGSKTLGFETQTPPKATTDADLQAFLEAGATGLEPATSGVTGRARAKNDPPPEGPEERD